MPARHRCIDRPNTGETACGAFLRVALVADVGPQLITFDPVDVKADHHAVVQLYAAPPDGERQPGDCLAIDVSETADGALADALSRAFQ